MGGLQVQPLLLLCWHPTDLRLTLIKHSSLLWWQTKHSPAEPGCGLDFGYIQYGYNWLNWLECHCYFLLFTCFVAFSCSLCCLTYRLQTMLFKGSLSGCPEPPNGEGGSMGWLLAPATEIHNRSSSCIEPMEKAKSVQNVKHCQRIWIVTQTDLAPVNDKTALHFPLYCSPSPGSFFT